MSWGDDNTEFAVVINDEGQYSIWPTYKAIPAGWKEVGTRGKKSECLAYIDVTWTDMRPLSLRRALEQDAGPASKPSP
jgi:MbtH protein